MDKIDKPETDDEMKNSLQNVSDWISSKLHQLEEKNQILKEENKKVNEELNKLKERYGGGKKKPPPSSPLRPAPPPPPPPPPPSSSWLTPETRRRCQHRKNHYQHGSKRDHHHHSNRPKDKDYRATAKNVYTSSSSSSSSSLTYSSDDDAYDEPSSSSNQSLDRDKNRNMRSNSRRCKATFTPKRHRPPTTAATKSSSLDRKLPNVKKMMYFDRIKAAVSGSRSPVDRKNFLVDYATLDRSGRHKRYRKRMEEADDDGQHRLNTSSSSSNNKPPTPPLHRLPSWESRIYEIANNGIQSTMSTPVQQFKKLDFSDFDLLSNSNNCPASPVLFHRGDTGENLLQEETIMNHHHRHSNLFHNKILLPNFGSEKDRPKFKSSTTSSGNESDSTTVNDMKLLNNHGSKPSLLLDACRDSLETLQIATTTKNVPPPPPSSLGTELLNETKLEKFGYLFKLCGQFKAWKRRWFVLQDGQLLYFKNKNDADRRPPKGRIVLDQRCTLIRAKELSFHLSYEDGKKNLHLSCDSIESYNEWLRAIGQTLTISNILKLQDNQVPIIENYIIKVRFGHSLKCWTALYNHHLVYFNNPFEKIPLGYTSLKDCSFQEMTSVADVEDVALIYDDIKRNIHYSISVHPKGNAEPIYLLFSTKQDFSLWYYHLKLSMAENDATKTGFEHLLLSLLNVESSTNSKEEFYLHEIWRNPLLTYSNETVGEPLTSIYGDNLRKEASKLSKSINLFLSVPIDLLAVDYHVALIQNCLQVCIDYPELQAELYYTLIKQSCPAAQPEDQLPSSAHDLHRTFWCAPHSLFKCDDVRSPPSEQPTTGKLASKEDKSNVSLQCFQFLAIAISIFLPQNQVLWLLKHHINRFKNETTESGKYALYCERALSRVLLNGPRQRTPSRMEVLSIIQRNPYQHSMPHSIPVHFANNSYRVIGFDGSTTVAEFTNSINSESGIRENAYSGFGLFSDDPIEKDVYHLLNLDNKLADAISYWESTLRKYYLGKFENTKIIKLTYRHRLCLKRHYKNETDKERLLWVYEINNEVINNRFPVTFDLAIELMSLMLQIEYGDRKSHNNNNVDPIFKRALSHFLPSKFHDVDSLEEIVSRRWSELTARPVLDCVRIYLNCTRKWELCGGKLFTAKVSNSLKYEDLTSLYVLKFLLKHPVLWIAVSEDFVELLEIESFRSLLRIPYKYIINYGNLRSHFMMVIESHLITELISSEIKSNVSSFLNQAGNGGQRLNFALPAHEIIEITVLISDYIEIKKTQTNNPI